MANTIRNLPRDLASLYESLPSESRSAKTDPENAFALHKLLSHLDPRMAARWHWRDVRKVLRNLHIIKEHGRMASDVISDAFGSGLTEK